MAVPWTRDLPCKICKQLLCLNKESPAKRKAASPKKKASTNGNPAKKVKVAKVKAPPADELEVCL